jgi:RNA polymerase sigma-70 factor (ECF subfamily)
LYENYTEVEFREQDERMMKIQKVLDGMTPHTRHILEECYLHEKKYKEVAAELNISISAVRKHIVKALKAIREEFAK